jgi:hypothetical protein
MEATSSAEDDGKVPGLGLQEISDRNFLVERLKRNFVE